MPLIRKASLTDIPGIHALVNAYAREELMLPRSLSELYENLRDFSVAADDDHRIMGCGALHVVWGDLAEIKCLAVAREHQKTGIGRALVASLVTEAKGLLLERIFCLTYEGDFFVKLGFEHTSKDSLPHKVWSECIRCPHFPDCNEEAYVLGLAR